MAFVVFAGQSNALGFGMTRATLPAGEARIDWLTFIWNNDARGWEIMVPGLNTGTQAHPEAWGPEVAFAAAFRASHPFEPLFIVKSAKGSTGLAADPNALDWSPHSPGEMFDLTTQRIAEARAWFPGQKVDAVFLFQGENDAYDALSAAAYEDNFRDWLAAIRANWMGDPQGEIAFGRIAGDKPFLDTVRQAQAMVDAEDPYASSFETFDLRMQGDGLHYAADSYLAIGQGFYSLYDDWTWSAPVRDTFRYGWDALAL